MLQGSCLQVTDPAWWLRFAALSLACRSPKPNPGVTVTLTCKPKRCGEHNCFPSFCLPLCSANSTKLQLDETQDCDSGAGLGLDMWWRCLACSPLAAEDGAAARRAATQPGDEQRHSATSALLQQQHQSAMEAHIRHILLLLSPSHARTGSAR